LEELIPGHDDEIDQLVSPLANSWHRRQSDSAEKSAFTATLNHDAAKTAGSRIKKAAPIRVCSKAELEEAVHMDEDQVRITTYGERKHCHSRRELDMSRRRGRW
jgi:hypothetical protein